MKRILVLLFFLPALGAAQPSVCTLSGVLYDQAGHPQRGATITVERTLKNGAIVSTVPIAYKTKQDGSFSFPVHRTIGTDTVVVYIFAKAPGYDEGSSFYDGRYGGVPVVIPDAPSAALEALMNPVVMPGVQAIAVPNLSVRRTQGDSLNTRTLELGGAFIVERSPADSRRTVLHLNPDSLVTDVTDQMARDIANGKGDADSLSAAAVVANAALPKADTALLHAQKFRDSENILAGTADADSVAVALGEKRAMADTTKPMGTVTWTETRVEVRDSLNTVVRMESDPTATSKAQTVTRDSLDAAFSNGIRSISTTGRISVAEDSLAFTELTDQINAALGTAWTATLNRNDTLSLSNMNNGDIVTIKITQSAAYTLTWAGVTWAGGVAPILVTTANKMDMFTFIKSGGIIVGTVIQNF